MQILQSLDIDLWGVFAQIVGFIAFIWFFKKLLYSPLVKILDDRQAEIKLTYDQLDADREAMQKTRADYEQRLAGIEAQAREQIQAAVKEAQELRSNILADAQKQAQATLEKGRADAEREREIAFLEMRKQIVDLSLQAAGKVIDEALDTKKHQAIVDDFIASVEFGASPSGSR